MNRAARPAPGSRSFFRVAWFGYLLASCVEVAIAADYCETIQRIASGVRQELPLQIDRGTRLFDVGVDCEQRLVTYSKEILVRTGQLRPGWRKNLADAHATLHCREKGFVVLAGWTVIDRIHDGEGRLLLTLRTGPEQCQALKGSGRTA